MYFSLGVFHDLHHTLRHSLYEALGREERAGEAWRLAGPLRPSCWQRKKGALTAAGGSNLAICKERLKTLRTFEPVVPLLGNHLEETGKKIQKSFLNKPCPFWPSR